MYINKVYVIQCWIPSRCAVLINQLTPNHSMHEQHSCSKDRIVFYSAKKVR